ncbi:MAG: T9SS type A sorting domain-containing protein [Flavobacteriales bacterium]|nr:T9SS type A sorting domain-containing protein [Flavobacteriales bacterium]
MNKTLRTTLACSVIALGVTVNAQRYLTEVFTAAEITETPDVIYGTNIDFLTSNLASPNVGDDLIVLQTAAISGQPIPPEYFDPTDQSTAVKVTNLRFDLYAPGASDTETARPLVIYLHTGDALPPPVNGSPNGTRKDSTAVEICRQLARRGYVAASMSYRLGWNPLAGTEQERRGQLLNAIYRAVHDVRQCTRFMKDDAANANTYAIDPNKIIVLGEGTGGYIAVANATLDEPAELFIEKFRPDPFEPSISYIDTLTVGNLDGFNGDLTLYQPNGQDAASQFCVNLGGALADTSWMAPGDAPMVAFHTTFDPFAPFTEGIVIVPTTGGPVVPVQGSNIFIQLANQYGNNDSFVNMVGADPYTTRARSLYGTTVSHGDPVTINTGVEGLFPLVTPDWPSQNPALNEEASPWQWWDPNSAAAQTVVIAGPPPITANQASLSSNPNSSGDKGRTYIDTIMGYMNPRIVCALELGPCSLVGIDENSAIAVGLDLYPNPTNDRVTITSSNATIERIVLFDMNGRQVNTNTVNAKQYILNRGDLANGVYYVQLHFNEGSITRKVVLQ